MIDPKLQDELRARFNPDGSQLRQLQLRMLEMLKYIDDICRENDITYWLSSGTCLGAVRHGGFIPWDDDVDIEMFHEDFCRLCKILKRKTDSQFVLQDHSTDKNYYKRFAKLRDLNSVVLEGYKVDALYRYHGVYIDIFHIAPTSSLKLSRAASFIWSRSVTSTAINIPIIGKLISRGFYQLNTWLTMPFIALIQKLFSTGKLRHYTGCSMHITRNDRDLKCFKRIPFETLELPVPWPVDGYLQSLFGNDYMTLPDIEDIPCHFSKIEL